MTVVHTPFFFCGSSGGVSCVCLTGSEGGPVSGWSFEELSFPSTRTDKLQVQQDVHVHSLRYRGRESTMYM